MELTVNKPAPFVWEKQLEKFNRNSDLTQLIEELEAGNPVLITTYFSDGLLLLEELQDYLKSKMPNKSFKEQREYRNAYRSLSNLIVIQIINHKLKPKKSPVIGWLEKLYPENKEFMLPFPQVQGLNSAWQWFLNGISIPVLRNKLHPYYGTYFPTRFEHLILFDNWLKRYEGPKKGAFDIGVGSGVLSLQMVKHGFQNVFATDTNSIAISGMKEFMGETKLSRKIELDFGHLFGKWEKSSELIVFNPPWLPTSQELGRLDEAIYYTENLFPEFFEEAEKRMLPESKLVIIFSNLAQITKTAESNPIEEELTNGGRFILEKKLTKKVTAASDKTKRDQHWRADEEVELWILVKRDANEVIA
jgi:hypothetical protein